MEPLPSRASSSVRPIFSGTTNARCLGPVGKAVRESIGDLHPRETVIALSLSIMILWIGLYPAPFLRMMNGSVQALVDRIDHGTVAVLKERVER